MGHCTPLVILSFATFIGGWASCLFAGYNYLYPKDAKLYLDPEGWVNTKYNDLRILEYPGSQLKSLPEHIGKFSNLRLLALTRGAFTQVPLSLYKTKSLRLLDFHYANVLNLHNEMNAWKLMVALQLEYNEMREIPKSFGELHNLRVLHLKGVRLKQLPESIANLSKLNFVHISATHEDTIREIAENLIAINDDSQSAWAHYLVKRNIYIRNKIKTTPLKPKEKYSLKKKSAQIYNGILDLSLLNSSLLEDVDNYSVEKLYLSYNQLEALSNKIIQFHSLKHLDCSVNELNGIPRWLSELNQLETISFASNCLISFPDEFISDLDNLRSLDLSNNKIGKLPRNHDGSFISNLISLDLSGNEISEIPKNFLKSFPELEEIILYGNSLDSEMIELLKIQYPKIKILF